MSSKIQLIVLVCFTSLTACPNNSSPHMDGGTQSDATDSSHHVVDGDTSMSDTAPETAPPTWDMGVELNQSPASICYAIAVDISADGSRAVVGDCMGPSNTGRVVVYDRSSTGWSSGITLTPPAGIRSFGSSVSISGDGNTIVAGDSEALAAMTGLTAVYSYNGTAWDNGILLSAPMGSIDFGVEVIISKNGNRIAVGDPVARGTATGTVTVFTKNAGAWDMGVALMAPTPSVDFGWALAISENGNRLVVADWKGGTNAKGAVLIYDETAGLWSTGTPLSQPANSRGFGDNIAISDDGSRVVVGDLAGAADQSGAVHVFDFVSGAWSSGLSLPRPSNAKDFGRGIELSGNGEWIIAGDYNGGVGSNGASDIYRLQSGTWTQVSSLLRPSDAKDFSAVVAASTDASTLLVGDWGGLRSGRSYARVYTKQ